MEVGCFGASDEFVGGDLALAGKITVAIRGLEGLKQMTKQGLAEVKLSGDLADGEAGPADDGLDGASAFEV